MKDDLVDLLKKILQTNINLDFLSSLERRTWRLSSPSSGTGSNRKRNMCPNADNISEEFKLRR